MKCLGNPLSRRGFLTVGAVGGIGLTLADLLSHEALGHEAQGHESKGAQASPDAAAPRAKSVIHIYLPGGIAHQESFDPKPFSPIEYRGELGVVKTKTGDIFSETLPKLAAMNDKIAVIRSMTHSEAAHERGTHNMFTGYRPSPALQYPSLGSVVSHEFGPRNNLPPYVCIPNQPNEFAGPGYLSASFAPFSLGADPAAGGFKVRDLSMADGVSDGRFARRKSALEAVDAYFANNDKSDRVAAMNTFYDRAYSLISSPKAREAFNIDAEPAAIRDEYGRNEAGQRMLMARRLVAAGVRMATLTYAGWDMHNNITAGMRGQMPALDQALSALIRDLDRTGLLKDTMVMVSSEFGRSPKINNNAGRDHWPKVFSVMLAGGGIKGGEIYGSSNATASEPDQDAVEPPDLAYTMYHCLGIKPEKKLMTPGNRPAAIVYGGKLLTRLLT